jgi:hypothetical protein
MSFRGNDTNSAICLPAVLAIGFTGHRSLADETKSRELISRFLAERKAATPATLYGVSSAAAGGDLLFAESCIQLGIPLRILLPAPAEYFRKDFEPATWLRVEQVLKSALSVEVTGDQQLGDERYYECGIQTVQQCQLLIALWDGQPSRGMGGTEEIAAYAKEVGTPVFWFHSETGELTVFHEETAKNLLHDPELDFLNHLPDCGVTRESDSAKELAQAWFQKIDSNASRFAPQVRRLASIPIVYTAAAALFSGAASRGHAAPVWLAASAALGIIAAALPTVLRLDQRQSLWARTRTAAEVCRSALALWSTSGFYEVIGPEVIPELSGTLMSLNFLKMEDGARNKVSLEEFKQSYRRERLSGQIKYYFEHGAKAARDSRRFRTAAWVFGGGGILIAIGLFAGKFGLPGAHVLANVKWLPLAISALFQAATVAGALVAVNDCNRREQRYRELHDWLKNWDRQLDALRTWPSVLQVAARVEKALLVELLEWRSLLRNTRLSGGSKS